MSRDVRPEGQKTRPEKIGSEVRTPGSQSESWQLPMWGQERKGPLVWLYLLFCPPLPISKIQNAAPPLAAFGDAFSVLKTTRTSKATWEESHKYLIHDGQLIGTDTQTVNTCGMYSSQSIVTGKAIPREIAKLML